MPTPPEAGISVGPSFTPSTNSGTSNNSQNNNSNGITSSGITANAYSLDATIMKVKETSVRFHLYITQTEVMNPNYCLILEITSIRITVKVSTCIILLLVILGNISNTNVKGSTNLNNNLNSSSLILTAGKVQDMKFTISNNNDFPLTNAVASIASESDDLKIVGDSLWSISSFAPHSRHEFITKIYASTSLIACTCIVLSNAAIYFWWAI